MHDSRAWFKPFGTNSEEVLVAMEILVKREDEIIAWRAKPVGPEPRPLTKAEFDKVARYRPDRNTASACYAAGFVSEGREGKPLSGGFLRYRKIYMGTNRFKPEGAVYVQVTPSADTYRLARAEDDKLFEHTV